MTQDITKSILSMNFPIKMESFKHFFVGKDVRGVDNDLVPLQPNGIDSFLRSVDESSQRLIVYLGRNVGTNEDTKESLKRMVVNERELFYWMSKGINKDKFVFLGVIKSEYFNFG